MVHAFDLWVGDKQVTMDNYSDIKPSGLTNGSISYNPDKKELTLKNVTFSTTGPYYFVQNTGIDGLKIYLNGDCSVTTYKDAFLLEKNTTIQALGYSGKLTITTNTANTNAAGLWLKNGAYVNVYWTDLVINAAFPIYGNTSNETVNMNCSTLAAQTNSSNAAVQGLKNFYLTSVHYENSSYKFSNGRVVDGSGNGATSVTTKANLRVNRQIVDLNATDVTTYSYGGYAGVSSGNIQWDKSTKTLTFNNVIQLCSNGYYNIDNQSVDGLKVIFKGTNTLSNSSADVIKSAKNLIIDGQNSATANLKATSNSNSWGIWMKDSNLTINNITLNVDAYQTGIFSQGKNSTLTINSANIDVNTRSTNGECKAIGNFANCNMSGSDVSLPSNCCYRKSLKGFGTVSALSADVTIKTINAYYPVSILGHQLNDVNYSAFDGLTSGTISYGSSTKKLTLNNVTIKSPDGNNEPAIYYWGGGNITLTGSNSITSAGMCFKFSSNAEINGSGSLNAKSEKSHCFSVYGTNTQITFNTTNSVVTQAAVYGYYGNISDKLILKKSSTDINQYNFAGEGGAISNLGELILDESGYQMDFDNSKYSAQNVGLYFAERKILKNNGEEVKDIYGVSFKSIKEDLGIEVAGKKLYRVSDSATDLIYVGSPYLNVTNGKSAAYYNPSTKTLTLNNATIKDNVSNLRMLKVNSSASGLIIDLKGTNTIETMGSSGLYVNDNVTVTIKGSDKNTLTAKGVNYGAFLSKGSTLHVNGAQVCFGDEDNTKYGLGNDNSMDDGEGGTLKISNSGAVKAAGKTWAIRSLKKFELASDIYLSRPSNGDIKTYGSGYGVYVGSKLATMAVLSNGKTIFDKMKGDVNNDGEITMSDAYAVVSYYLATTKPANFDVTLADMTNDGEITMADAYAIVVIYLESNK